MLNRLISRSMLFILVLQTACSSASGSSTDTRQPDTGSNVACYPAELGYHYRLPWISLCHRPCAEAWDYMNGTISNRTYRYESSRLTGWHEDVQEGSGEEIALIYDDHGLLQSERNDSEGGTTLSWSPRSFQWNDVGRILHALSGSMSFGFDDAYHYDEGRLDRIERAWRDSGRLKSRTQFIYGADGLKYVEEDSDADGGIDIRTTFLREEGRVFHYLIDRLQSGGRSSYYLQYDEQGRVAKRESEFTGSGFPADTPRYKNQYGATITQFGTFSYNGCSEE